jgi:hypothetical protein
MVIRVKKPGDRPVDRSASVLAIVTVTLFHRSSRVHLTLLGQCERLPYTEIVVTLGYE